MGAREFLVAFGMVACMSASAADNGQRKEAVLDGKYFRIVASAPDFAKPPTDLFNRPGVGIAKDDTGAAWEVNFDAPLAEERTAAIYKVRMTETTKQDKNFLPDDARGQAGFLLKTEGLDIRNAVAIEPPKVPFADATVVAYRAEGIAFDDPKHGKRVSYVVGVSFPGNKVGYAMSGSIITPVATFDANPAKFDKGARRAFNDLVANTRVERKK
jgi:hypothetical protein